MATMAADAAAGTRRMSRRTLSFSNGPLERQYLAQFRLAKQLPTERAALRMWAIQARTERPSLPSHSCCFVWPSTAQVVVHAGQQ